MNTKTQAPQVMILWGDGINCEHESLRAIERSGGQGKLVHIHDFLNDPDQLLNYQMLVFPGGFSFGDELGSGKVLALKLKKYTETSISTFLTKGGLILGICNGFQVLTQLGLLPFADFKQSVTLTHNEPHGFQDRHVQMTVESNPSYFLKDMTGKTLEVPIRHGEGRLVCNSTETEGKIKGLKLAALQYTKNVNGSLLNIAGLTDPSGQILGLMPHPEVFFDDHAASIQNKQIFDNAIQYIRQRFYES